MTRAIKEALGEVHSATARMVVIYRTPKDIATFDRHYFGTHVPLVRKLSGLRKYEVSKGPIASPIGGAPVHLVATLHFDDMTALRNAFASLEGHAAALDRRTFAPDDDQLTMLLYENHEV